MGRGGGGLIRYYLHVASVRRRTWSLMQRIQVGERMLTVTAVETRESSLTPLAGW